MAADDSGLLVLLACVLVVCLALLGLLRADLLCRSSSIWASTSSRMTLKASPLASFLPLPPPEDSERVANGSDATSFDMGLPQYSPSLFSRSLCMNDLAMMARNEHRTDHSDHDQDHGARPVGSVCSTPPLSLISLSGFTNSDISASERRSSEGSERASASSITSVYAIADQHGTSQT